MNTRNARFSVRVFVVALLALTLFALPLMAEGQKESSGQVTGEIKMALGDIESIEVMHLLIALEKVRERGIDVELISYKSEDVANQAVVNGQAHIGIGTPYPLIQNVGAPIRIFYQLAMVKFFPVVNTDYYNSWEELDGEEIVVHSRTSATLALVQLMAQRNNIEYGKISYVPGSEVRAVSLLQGNIRATILDSYNKDYVLDQDPDKYKVLDVADVTASDEALFANLDFIQSNTEVVSVFVEELLSTVEQINDDPSYVVRAREEYGLLPDLPEELEGEMLPYYQQAAADGMFPEDGGGARAARQDFQFYGAAGQIEGDPDELRVEDFWYLEPLNRVLGNN